MKQSRSYCFLAALLGCLISLIATPGLAAPGDVLFADTLNGNLNQWTVVGGGGMGMGMGGGGGDASIGNETANQGRSLRLRWGPVSVESDPIAAAVPAARFDVWIRRGADSFSEDPDANEDLAVEYRDDTGGWSTLELLQGNGTPGEIYNRSYLLPGDALYAGLQVRFRTTGGDGPDWDYWHVDDVSVIEVAAAPPLALGSCEAFEGGLGNWVVLSSGGDAGISTATANSPANSLFLRWGAVTVTSGVIDLNGALLVDLDVWVRRGADSFSEDPDGNEDLVIEFLDNGGSWIALETFIGQDTPGEVFARTYALPAAALHAGFQIRFRQTGGNGSDWDYWHVDDVCLTSTIEVSYRFEESSWSGVGGEVVDTGAGAVNGTAVGGAANADTTPAIPTDPGTCKYADFDGVDDYIEVPDHPSLDLSDALTVAAWVNVRTLPSGLHTIVSKDWNYEFHINSGGQVFWWWNDSGGTTRSLTTAASLSLNQWHHVAIVYESGAQTIFIDGSPAATSSFTGTLRLNDVPLFIGTDWNFISRAFDGFIDEVNIFSRSLSQADVQSLMAQTHACPTAGAQFVLNHDNFGIHCLAETLTVDVVDSSAGTPLINYNATITLDTQSGDGSWALVSGSGSFTDATPDDGLAAYDWSLGESQAVFALTYPQGIPSIDIDVFQASDPGIRDTDAEGQLVFHPNGFTLTAAALTNPPPAVIVPFDSTQTAASSFPVYLTAYGQTPNDPVCGVIEGYTGAQALKFWFQYLDPVGGSRVVEIDGLPVPAAEAAASAQNVVFTNGQAAVTGFYKDVGLMQLLVKDDTTLNPELPLGIRGATADFVVRPQRFEITDVRDAGGGTPNPQAGDATGPVFIAAGAPFRATVTALDAMGDPTPNYGQEIIPETVRLDVSLVAPLPGASPPVSAGTGFGPFAGGSATGFDFVWREVGIINVVPGIGDADYLGAGDIAGDTSEDIGRFIPDHFTTALNVPMFQTACTAGGFTYRGQDFNYLVAPVMTATARAVGGSATLNYTVDYFKLSTATLQNRLYQSTEALDLNGVPPPAADPVVTETGPGVATLVFSGGAGISYSRGLPAEPFLADIQLSIDVIDADGVQALGNPVTFGGGPGILFSAGEEIRYGRVRLGNALGSERVDLPVPMITEYYLAAGSGFVSNGADSCSTNVTLGFSAFTEGLNPGETCALDSGAPGSSGVGCAAAAPPGLRFEEPPLLGDFNLRLAAPGDGNQGSLIITGSVPDWLKFDWNSSIPGDEDPAGQATFGIFSGSSRQIYFREVY